MNLLLDTNIILSIVRAKKVREILKFINPDYVPVYLSIVSVAEIKSFALRKKWGIKRLEFLDGFLQSTEIIDINKSFINTYAEIDAFSQRANPNLDNFTFDTPRNMGKNDLWIASLAALLGLKLVTTDSDFDHLHNVFFEVRKIKPEEFIQFF